MKWTRQRCQLAPANTVSIAEIRPVCALRDAAPSHVDAIGAVEPDLLDRRIVQQRLQNAESADRRQHVAHQRRFVVDHRVAARQREVVVAADLGLRDASGLVGGERGIGAFGAQTTAHAFGDDEGRLAHPGILARIPNRP
ncbi:hypothetical protein KEC56_13295 [Microbacterium sp. YMB-B2]|uniref:Uncharacterized protein n=1 Tax=Microbacterium tenebrionis TaxID=2830665 RepID=A0A9X1LRS0_9MICO|nr:hypothetical protein [Microbacterium tenebrionis]MCC2030473.1 hypothetical protein [Microbacterium tenebrionis]